MPRLKYATILRILVILGLLCLWVQILLSASNDSLDKDGEELMNTNETSEQVLAQVPVELHKYLTVHPRNVSGNATDRNGSPNISDILHLINKYNDAQTIHNEDIFGPVQNDTLIIAIQVHTRLTYLRHLIVSLAQAKDIDSTLLVFSHDYYDEEVNALVRSIDFTKENSDNSSSDPDVPAAPSPDVPAAPSPDIPIAPSPDILAEPSWDIPGPLSPPADFQTPSSSQQSNSEIFAKPQNVIKKKRPLKRPLVPQHIEKSIETLNSIKDQVLSHKEIEDEFSFFAKNIASQLRQLPLVDALDVQSEILQIVKRKRINRMQLENNSTTLDEYTMVIPEDLFDKLESQMHMQRDETRQESSQHVVETDALQEEDIEVQIQHDATRQESSQLVVENDVLQEEGIEVQTQRDDVVADDPLLEAIRSIGGV